MKRFNNIKRTLYFLLALTPLFSIFQSSIASALSQTDIQSIYSDTVWYDPSGSGACLATGAATGGSEALSKQVGLDPQWIDLINKDANKYGTNPIAMASILYWENRGWPKYENPAQPSPRDSDGNGRGPWQIIKDTWGDDATYMSGVYSLEDSTDFAALFIKGLGGVAGTAGGSIDQDFSSGKNIPSMATVMKSYNAGGGTYRIPSIASHAQSDRQWGYDKDSAFFNWANRDSDKPKIIDDYIVAGTYLYYQIGSGTAITYKDTDSYVAEALTKQDEIKNFSGGGGSGGVCEPSCSPGGSDTGDGKTVVIDPGHSPTIDANSKDAVTGLYTADYPNPPPEMQSAFTVAVKIKGNLTSKGYRVVLTKNSADEKIDLAERARRANSANPALLFTIHGDVSARYLAYPDERSTRVPNPGPRRDGINGLVNPSIIGPSKDFATKLAPLIAQKTGVSSYKATSFYDYYGADGLTGNGRNAGNTPVQTILSKVPSVYSEFDVNALNDGFADAVSDAIAEVLGQAASTATTSSTGCGAVAGSRIQTAANYSWSDYRSKDSEGPQAGEYAIKKPPYKAKIAEILGKEYTGPTDTIYAGVDCGAFVTRVMRDSGADPEYNKYQGPTSEQERYMKDNPSKYKYLGDNFTSTDQGLEPGDIAITSTHTFMYVGTNPGFNGNSASASISGPKRAPMASDAYWTDVDGVKFKWYRLIAP